MKAPEVLGAFIVPGVKGLTSVQDHFEQQQREARKHLRSLVHGIDPHTFEQLSGESVVADPEIRRSLELALDALETAHRRRLQRPPYIARVSTTTRIQQIGELGGSLAGLEESRAMSR